MRRLLPLAITAALALLAPAGALAAAPTATTGTAKDVTQSQATLTATVDPFAGSYLVESLTDEIESRAWELIEKVEELGGSTQALEFIQRDIEESASSYHERYRTGQDIIVGVNKYVTDQVDDVDILKVDPEAEQRQLTRLKAFKESRDQAKVDAVKLSVESGNYQVDSQAIARKLVQSESDLRSGR